MTSEKIFVVGATGNVGAETVKELLANNVPVTLYVRNPSKVKELFGQSDLISLVEGDFEDLTPIKQGIAGHTRLFLLGTLVNMAATKGEIARYAFDAGVKQIVDISSQSSGYPWRSSSIAYTHYQAEKRLVEETPRPKDAFVVTLRPGRFMSNLLTFDRPYGDAVADIAEANYPQGWISPRDIGHLAAIILQDSIAKHGDGVYELVGDVVTPQGRAQIFENALGRPFAYRKITSTEKFNTLSHAVGDRLPHGAILELATAVDPANTTVSRALPILLKREPETLEEYVTRNKKAF
ncbi:NAD(P)-binding protein [Hesseltinella vesiculosa]|uniref:NAD(P)-binding protein n=1 Tax=Hesseltinella vesiculosa TaxID=101127 RepID=A0A1X2GG76_9FUNG|nr:NAD(P)-binding protein [Hesseltinella vesiculosa]